MPTATATPTATEILTVTVVPVAVPGPPAPSVAAAPASATMGEAVRQASEAVADVDLGDARWSELGPVLTRFVDTARQAVGLDGSPIAPGEDVGPALRLRDLARLAARAASPAVTSSPAPAQVTAGVRSVQAAARRCPSG